MSNIHTRDNPNLSPIDMTSNSQLLLKKKELNFTIVKLHKTVKLYNIKYILALKKNKILH